MPTEKKNHGEPPSFVKWLIWLFRKDTWKEQPIIAFIATMIVVFVAGSAVYGVYSLLPDQNQNDFVLAPVQPKPAPTPKVVEPVSTLRLEIEIKITYLPPEGGGPDSRGEIGGRIDNLPEPQQYKIVLYALTDLWYVQPLVSGPYTDIGSDGKWSNWTHFGHSYAALLVLPSYKPDFATEELPGIGEGVLSKVTVPAK